MTLRLLDLFCGAGGAAAGYAAAGFEVTGVDIKPQPNYPYEFHQGDAMSWPLEGFDVIHASPPCQAYSTATREPAKHPDLYIACRRRLLDADVPWAIENVMGAPYRWGLQLCGTMFALEADGEWLRRHRNFETSQLMLQELRHRHRTDRRAVTITSKSYLTITKDCARHSRQPTYELAQKLMQIDWMTRRELAQAIPPAYTRYIGERIRETLPGG